MNKNRLEAFSDGVFAIVITLLILEVHISPNVPENNLRQALITILPSILSYVMSFVLIGMYWVFHHFYSDKLKQVDGRFIWMNMLMLLLVSFLPFPTSLMGRYPFAPLPIQIYGINLMACNLVAFLIQLYVSNNAKLHGGALPKDIVKNEVPFYLTVNSSYLIAILISNYMPLVSYVIYAGLLMLLVVRTIKRINQ